MAGLPNGEKILFHFDRIHEYDRHLDRRTDRQTPHNDIGRTCKASRAQIRTKKCKCESQKNADMIQRK